MQSVYPPRVFCQTTPVHTAHRRSQPSRHGKYLSVGNKPRIDLVIVLMLIQGLQLIRDLVVIDAHIWIIKHVADDALLVDHDKGMAGIRTIVH